jgi:hypothetical protein
MDEGFCVPTLDRWFTAPYRVLTKYVKGGPNCDRRYKIYFQLAIGSNRISPKNTELAIFGFEDQTQRLTNIDDEENSWIMDAISTFFKKNMFQLYPFAPKTTEVNSITEVCQVTGYYFGVERSPGPIVVDTFIYHVGVSYQLPFFTTCFDDPTHVKSRVITRLPNSPSFAIFLHRPHQRPDHYEILVFRQRGHLLFSVIPQDEEAIGRAIC